MQIDGLAYEDIFFHFHKPSEPATAAQLETNLRIAKEMEAIIRQCVYVIDYFHKKIIYITDSKLVLCGVSRNEFLAQNYTFFFQHTPIADLQEDKIMYRAWSDFVQKYNFEERNQLCLSHDFRLLHINGREILLRKTVKITEVAKNGMPQLSICTLKNAGSKQRNAYIRHNANRKRWCYCRKTGVWIELPYVRFSDREKDIIYLVRRAFSEKEIAKKLNISISSVKKHKQLLFPKTGTDNMFDCINFFEEQERRL